MATKSIYLTNGRPLLQQALYQQKLRQGIYNSPSNPSIGVNSNALDAAALLAALLDLTVKPSYERTVAQEAQDAADAAKNGRTSTFSLQKSSSASAAAAALGVQGGTGIPSYKSDNVYKVALANSSYLITSRTDPTSRDFRHGLPTKLLGETPAPALSLNWQKVSSVALKNSSKLLNLRLNPELDYRSGLQLDRTEYLTEDEEKLSTEGAIALLKNGVPQQEELFPRIRTKLFAAADVVNATLLNAANKAAEERLKALNSLQPLDFKQQAQLYAKALTVAQHNANERIAENKKGLIDCGGGLKILSYDLQLMAAQFVKPVLDDLEAKGEEQRRLDNVNKEKHQAKVKAHEDYKREQTRLQLEEKAAIEQAKRERVTAHEAQKDDENTKYDEFQTARNGEVDDEVVILKDLEAKHKEEKEALIAEKQGELDKIEAEETELINGRKEELLSMQAEKDEEIKPTLDELEIETGKLKELTDARDALLTEVESSETTNKNYLSQIEELERKLNETKASIEEFTTKLEDATTKHEETTTHVNELEAHANEELPKLNESSKDLEDKIFILETSHDENTALKSKYKEDILSHLDEKVKTEHKINEELPDHLKRDINEKKLKDTSSIFSTPVHNVESKKEEVEVPNPSATGALSSAAVARAAPEVTSPEVTSPTKRARTKSNLKKFVKYFADTQANKPRTNSVSKSSAPAVETKPKPEITLVQKDEVKSEAADVASTAETVDAASLKKNGGSQGVFKEEI